MDDMFDTLRNKRSDPEFAGISDDAWVLNNFLASASVLMELLVGDSCEQGMEVTNKLGGLLDNFKHAQSVCSEKLALEVTPDQAFTHGFFAGAIAYRLWAMNQDLPVKEYEILFLLEQKINSIQGKSEE